LRGYACGTTASGQVEAASSFPAREAGSVRSSSTAPNPERPAQPSIDVPAKIDLHYYSSEETWDSPSITIHHPDFQYMPIVSIPSKFLEGSGGGVNTWSYVYDVIAMAVDGGGVVVAESDGKEYTRSTTGAPVAGDYVYRKLGEFGLSLA
jgi:hypothetical protein